MKRLTLLYLLFSSIVLAIVCFVACINSSPVATAVEVEKEKTSQDIVIDFLRTSESLYNSTKNDIQKKEFISQYKKEFYVLLDSLGFLTNWKGTIKDIRCREVGKSIALSFTIEIYIETLYDKYDHELRLECEHILNAADKYNDPIYQNLYNLSNYSRIRFDGFPRTNSDYSLYWNNLSEDLCVSYPWINFWVTGIRPASSEEVLSQDLIDGCNLALESGKLLRKKNNKEINQKEYNSLAAEIKVKNEETNAKLTEEERKYLTVVSTNVFYNITYSK